ncbi:hypothetical protein [Nonomuraea sp. NPDC048916]|uniref:hypothetical protein n=1 Tax=Nonomuraea sp. NPDC048916 TaxID=3154232 RepID=UPI0033DACA92
MIKMLHKMGVKSNHAYLAGTASIGLSVASWLMSKKSERGGLDRADRLGIFIGEWAPTFFALGVALRIEETHRDIEKESEAEVIERASTKAKQPTHAGV